MPTSHPNQLNEIVQIAELVSPMRVLDVGIGNGKFGFLLREYLGLNRGYSKEEFVVDGVEGFPEYITDVHREIYNKIHTLDLSESLNLISDSYDLCLLIDVVEHFEREKGFQVMDHLVAIGDCVLVATPWDVGDLSIRNENPMEDHKYQWTKRDFAKYPNVKFVYNRNSLIAVIGRDDVLVNEVARKMRSRWRKAIYDYVRRLTGLKKG
jgi:SAM-dependent methyltransferase